MSQSNEPFDPYYQWLGIPPDEQPPNHYRLLGIQLFEGNREVIQHAGDRQMAHLRSFQNGPRAAQSQKLLNEVAAAKLCLLSPDRKAAYDSALAPSCPDVPAALPPPIAPDLPVQSSAGITFAGAPGTLSADPAFRASRISRPRRRRSLLPWLLALVGIVVAALALWSWWSDRLPSERLILEWPAAMREEASLQIDGRPLDPAQDALAGSAEALEFALPPGNHRVQITRPGYEPIEQSIELAGGTPARMEVAFVVVPQTEPDTKPKHPTLSVGRVVLQWPVAARVGASLEVDGRVVDLTRRSFMDNPDTVETALKAGPHTLHVVLGDGQILDRSFTVEAGGRWELTVATTPIRLVLHWPEADRQDARLELNGQPRDIAADSITVDAEQIVFEVQPGKHTVRISRPSFEDFRADLADMQEEQRLDVTWVAAPHVRPAQAELRKLCEEFKKKYEKFEQYEKWAAEKDPTKQHELLRFLLAKLESEAASLPAQSAELWAACDEILNLALTGQQFILAQNLLTGTVGSDLFSDPERQAWEDRIWQAALKSARVDNLADYLRLCKTAGRLPTEPEQAVIVQRLSEAASAGVDHADIAARIQELQDQTVLGKAAAIQAQVAVYVKAAERESAPPAQTLDLCERILTIIPLVFESGQDDVAQQVDKLADAVADALRRKSLKEARTSDEVRMRMWRLEEAIKVVREWASQFPRVQAARKMIADGQATAVEHKLVAFWLLQLGHYSAALPHLCNAEDEALVHMGQALPDTAKGLATLADEVELESKKSKYSRRHEEALRGFVRYLRQSALDKKDTSLQPAERVELQKKLSAAETQRSEIDNRRFPKEQWCNLALTPPTTDNHQPTTARPPRERLR